MIPQGLCLSQALIPQKEGDKNMSKEAVPSPAEWNHQISPLKIKSKSGAGKKKIKNNQKTQCLKWLLWRPGDKDLLKLDWEKKKKKTNISTSCQHNSKEARFV